MLFVDDTTALELIRRSDLATVADTMWFLLRRGTRIAIAERMPPQREPAIPRAPMPLGWRTGAFKKDGWEYKEYEHSIRNMLTSSRVRAAILRGGIVWRLAVEILGVDGVQDAARGPVMGEDDFGRAVRCKRGDPWYENALSDQELDVLSGLYHVYSGENILWLFANRLH